MKIAIITPILYDATSPFNHLMHDILEGLLNAGHGVTRIVAVENDGDTDYRMGLDEIEYIPVKRKKSEKSNVIKRYISDTLANIKMARLLRKTKADVLFEDVSYSSFWSVSAAKKAGMRIVSMIQDVWPDNAVQTGLINDGSLIYKYFEYWQKRVYKKSDRIICISDDMKAFVASKGVNPEKIDVVYNWGYTDETVDIAWEENEFVKKFGLSKDCFYAVYAGNIGRMQNVELILQAAERLKENDKIRFLIVGDGVRREEIQKLANEKSLPNLTFLPLQPPGLATSIYSAAGVNLIPLVRDGIKTALPSKTGVVLSCGKPVIMCIGENTKFAAHINDKCGFIASADDPSDLVEKILRIRDTDSMQYKLGTQMCFGKLFRRSENIKKYVIDIVNEQ